MLLWEQLLYSLRAKYKFLSLYNYLINFEKKTVRIFFFSSSSKTTLCPFKMYRHFSDSMEATIFSLCQNMSILHLPIHMRLAFSRCESFNDWQRDRWQSVKGVEMLSVRCKVQWMWSGLRWSESCICSLRRSNCCYSWLVISLMDTPTDQWLTPFIQRLASYTTL